MDDRSGFAKPADRDEIMRCQRLLWSPRCVKMYRLLKLGIYDPRYLAQFYSRRPALGTESYALQHAALIADRAASSDFWTSALAKFGYETADIIANAEPLQRRWAIENNVAFDPSSFVFDIAAAQIAAFRPEVLLVADYSTFTPAFLRDIRAACPWIRLIVGWCGAPYTDLAVMRAWDVALSCIPEMVADFTACGLAAYHVDHGFDPRILDEIERAGQRTEPFSFLGSVMVESGFHLEREALLASLLRSTPLRIWSDVDRASSPSMKAQIRATVRNALPSGDSGVGAVCVRLPGYRALARWARRPGRGGPRVDPRIAARAEPALYGLDMFRQLRDSDVTLNTHINVSPKSASNMRLFEATGVGSCLLTDWKSNISELFEPESEVVTYASAAEAAEKFRYLADHPAQRRAIAAAGQRRALRDHNFDRRADRINAILDNALRTRRS